jgi:hypothetical protein
MTPKLDMGAVGHGTAVVVYLSICLPLYHYQTTTTTLSLSRVVYSTSDGSRPFRVTAGLSE